MDDFDDFLYLLDLWNDSRSTIDRRRGYPERSESDRLAAFAKLKELFLTEDELSASARALAKALRSVVEHTAWYICTAEDGSMKTVLDQQSQEVVLSIHSNAIEEPCLVFDGPDLVRAIPSEVDRLQVFNEENQMRCILRDQFCELESLVVSVELEEMLVSPAPGQVDMLKEALFLVEAADDRQSLVPRTKHANDRIAYVYTHKDKVSYKPVVEMKGKQLFKLVAESCEVDGIILNSTSHTGHKDKRINRLMLSPAFACRILEGDDIRPGVRPLPARNLDEIKLWLEFYNFPSRNRELIEDFQGDETLVRAIVNEDTDWRMHETDGTQTRLKGPVSSPVFSIAVSPENEKRASEILCPGLLAKKLGPVSLKSKDPETFRKPGFPLIVGRLVSREDQLYFKKRLQIAQELAAFLSPGNDSISRAACLTVKGARVLSQSPHVATRAWIEKTIEFAEKYTRTFVWGL